MYSGCWPSALTRLASRCLACRSARREWKWATSATPTTRCSFFATAARRYSSGTHKASTSARDARALARRQLGSKLRRPAGMFIVHNEGMGMAALALEVRMVEWQILMGVLEDL